MIAALCSVTVSIAAETKGVFKETFLLNLLAMSTSLGKISEYFGTNNISSKVNARFLIFIFIFSF